jgi:hypothetical protein
MSEARNGRLEIDLDEIEKQLRRSVEQAPPPKNDPLAELARIVGQDDPFRGLFANSPDRVGGHAAPPVGSPGPRPGQERGFTPGRIAAEVPAGPAAAQLSARRDADAVLHGNDDVFDPVSDAYGSPESAFDTESFSPLPPRRSRKKLVTVGALVVAAVVGTAGTLAWRNGTGRFAGNSGAPPIIKADNAPLKVAPENPGGMEIPNQNRQIYERATPESQTRVVDQREQPIDVREAARSLPAAPPASNAAPASPAPAESTPPAQDVAASDPGRRPPRSNALAGALGEPRRVRTVSVRPDGTLFDAPPAPALVNATPALVPAAGSLPPPVQVATIPISIGGTASTSPSAPAAAPTAQPPAAPASATGATPTGPVATVLPPQRPRPDGRSAAPEPAGARVATIAPTPEAAAPTPGASTTRAYSVQLGIRPSEQEAHTAATQLASKFAADLGGRSPAVARAEVSGKTVYRMRVGPMSRDEANALCTRLKSSGGQCFVALN